MSLVSLALTSPELQAFYTTFGTNISSEVISLALVIRVQYDNSKTPARVVTGLMHGW
jgi:hypothetical protein